jgi:hypothetical protein
MTGNLPGALARALPFEPALPSVSAESRTRKPDIQKIKSNKEAF